MKEWARERERVQTYAGTATKQLQYDEIYILNEKVHFFPFFHLNQNEKVFWFTHFAFSRALCVLWTIFPVCLFLRSFCQMCIFYLYFTM